MMAMFSAQKKRKLIHSLVACPAKLPRSPGQAGQSTRRNVCTAWPPIQAWMPNQPQATSARKSAGRLEPYTP